MKTYYFVRHCQANGQSKDATLTQKGNVQSHTLAQFFSDIHLQQIISSPYKRTIQSIEPLAHMKQLTVKIDDSLSERVLSNKSLDDWVEKLKLSFTDLNFKCEGGESSQEAMERIVEILHEQIHLEADQTLFVTHGNLMSLLLKHVDPNIGFNEWKNLSQPDVYVLKYVRLRQMKIERIWNDI
ncbi:histidine phosphatase family protein [Bacillus sp. 179-C3.3 HS]|uniref:histidine phosphatase family protein n=1 Tax=Bacillus sp. 179-C3.3 HS TaxID=3232162 RepID=UPI0039A0A36E